MKVIISLVLSLIAIPSTLAKTNLKGAGSNFPFPIYSKWFSEYEKMNNEVEFEYQAVGSSLGMRQLRKNNVDFSAADAIFNESSEKYQYIPTVMGALALTYNLEGIKELKLSKSTISDIYTGKIKKWNHPDIVALNPGVVLPDLTILSIAQPKQNGSSRILIEYLNLSTNNNGPWSKSSLTLQNNSEVTKRVKNTNGSFGYVEYAYAHKNHLLTAKLKNKSGVFIAPSFKTITASAQKNSRSNKELFNSKTKNAYPLSTFSYLVLPKNSKVNNELKKFLSWVLNEGQNLAPRLNYAPLPKDLTVELLKGIQ